MIGSLPAILRQLASPLHLISAMDLTRQNLQPHLHQMEIVANAAPTHLIYIDRNERIQFANRAMAEAWKVDPNRIVGRSILEIVGAETRAALHSNTEKVLKGEVVQYEYAFPLPDGSTRYFRNSYHPDFSPDGTVAGFVVTGTDVTAPVLARQKIEKNAQELLQERELRERFVTMLTHDLRTPLTAAKMCAQLAARDSALTPSSRRLISRMTESLDRMDRMIRDLLDANRINGGEEIPLEVEYCDVPVIFRSVLEELATIHGDRFHLKTEGQLGGFFSCDGLRRILENLCTNAVKYGSIELPIQVKAAMNDGRLRIEVHNWGPAIPLPEQSRLFDEHRRTESAKEAPIHGWGLGLTLVRGLALAHGGKVGVRSSDAEGTTFTVELETQTPSAKDS